jgi:hypothetical protein
VNLGELAALLTSMVGAVSDAIKADPDTAEAKVRVEMAYAVRKIENEIREKVSEVRGMPRAELDDLMADLRAGNGD